MSTIYISIYIYISRWVNQQLQPHRSSAASLHFKTPGDLGLAGASPKPPGFFEATL